MRDITRDKLIFAAALVITIGALVSRGSAAAGFWISFSGLALLFLAGMPRAFKGVAHYRSLPPLSRAWIALQGVELIIIVNSLIAGRMMYFFVLVVLAAEYFIYDSEQRR